MSTPTEVPLPSLQNDLAAYSKVKRIQLFVIPASFLEWKGFRVCLRISTANGHGWSELFIKKAEKPADWIRWSSLLLKYIGTLPRNAPFLIQRDDGLKDVRMYHLFAAAAMHIESPPYTFPNVEYDHEENELFERAVSYISLF